MKEDSTSENISFEETMFYPFKLKFDYKIDNFFKYNRTLIISFRSKY